MALNSIDRSHEVYLALGSNLGDRLAHLRAAVAMLQAKPGVEFHSEFEAAPVYETQPAGMAGEPLFLNTAIRITATMSPAELLRQVLGIEAAMGRVRPAFGGGAQQANPQNRTIDIDLLLYDFSVVREPGLVIPHPRLHERLFVLVPLTQIAGSVRHPVLGRTIDELLYQLRLTTREPEPVLLKSAEWAMPVKAER